MSSRLLARALTIRLLLGGAVLVPLWGLGLPAFLMLDPLAAPTARVGGALAAAGAVLVALAATRWRLARRPIGQVPGRAAADLGLATALAALALWAWGRSEPRVPYLEQFSLLCLQVVTGWGTAIALYVAGRALLRRQPVPAPVASLPGIRTVFTAAATVLGLLAAVVLGIGIAGRAAGARDRELVSQLRALADLGAAGLSRADTVGEREGVLQALELSAKLEAKLLPPDRAPDVLARATTWAPGAADHLIAVAGGARLHLLRAETPHGVLWLVAGANVRPEVRAPNDAPGLIILALLVLTAPLAAWLVGHDLRVQLRRLTTALRALAVPTPAAAGVPVSSNDEVGDLAAELNAICRRFEEENRRLAADLEAAAAGDRARSRFLAAASHELRNPLNSIIGFCHVLRERGPLSEAQREDIELIRSAGDQLLRRVDDILDLSRIEAGEEQPLEPAPVDLAALARAVLDARGEDVAPGVTVGLDAAPDTPPALADPARIRQVLENLVGNALKFTREGFVQVGVGPHPEGVHVQVADSGPGIPEEELDSIFTEFHRVESQRQVAGTGLGLAIAKRIVDRHHGRLWVESTLGQGSTFHVVLPAAPAGPSAPASPEREGAS